MNKQRDSNWLNPAVNRRTFLKVSGALASAPMVSQVFTKSKAYAAPPPTVVGENLPDSIETAEDIIYSVCQ
ncbi:MAG: twin-arginine translocation signal domain-containing protein, partial [Candidatus Deferrimicrobiaceae bacterium]